MTAQGLIAKFEIYVRFYTFFKNNFLYILMKNISIEKFN